MSDEVLGQFQHLQFEKIAQGMGIQLGNRIVGQIQFPEIGHVHKVRRIDSLDVVLGEVTGKKRVC